METKTGTPKSQFMKGRCKSAQQTTNRRRFVTLFDFRQKTSPIIRTKEEMEKKNEEPNQRKNRKQVADKQTPIDECRKMFQKEILILSKEVDNFKKTCQSMMLKERSLLTNTTFPAVDTKGHHAQTVDPNRDSGDIQENLQQLEKNMEFLEKQQSLLDREQSLLEQEEQLAQRQEKLKAHEQEIEEVEQMLEKRQALCEKRTQEVEVLNDEVLVLRQSMRSDVDNILEERRNQCQEPSPLNSDQLSSERAKYHWSIVRRNLLDKVTVLEATVQKYRTEVASAATNITAKDMMISRLTDQTSTLKSEVDAKDRKIRQLETQLALTLQEHRNKEHQFDMLLEELQNMDFTSSNKPQTTQGRVPSKITKKLFKKQHSTASLLSTDASATDPEARQRTPKSGEFLRRSFLGRPAAAPRKLRGGNESTGNGLSSPGLNRNGEGRQSQTASPALQQGRRTPINSQRSKTCSVM